MGNRAVITTTKRDMGVYLHWNGGRDSVEGFLEYCRMRGFRSPECDDYGWARLCQVVGNFMGASGLSVGIWPYPGDTPALEAGSDNGVYVTKGWRVVERVLPWDGFREQDEYPLRDMLLAIDAAQPEGQRLGGYLLAEEVAVGEVKLGDSVYMRQVSGAYEAFEVIGFGEPGRVLNGLDVTGVPYVAMYGDIGYENNVNNYLRGGMVRRARPRVA